MHRIVLALVAAPFAIGGILITTGPPADYAITCRASLKNAPRDHLARCDHGASVRASSTQLWHPLFIIDGRIGSPSEKWASFPGDKRPWIEVSWEKPVRARRIVLHHAGAREAPALSMADFDIRIRAEGAWRTLAEVRGNREAVTQHEFAATSIDRVHLDILKKNSAGNPQAHLYELEVFGD